MNQTYIDTVRLLLAIAPAVFASGRFAMKGGTALNLFVQQMPRLSVDIDLVLVDHRPDRHAALQAIGQELVAVQAALAGQGYRAHMPANTDGDDVKLVASNETAQVKVEVNFVFRGTALPIETRSLVATAQDLFTTDLAVPVLATAKIYGSKLVAAMDRQHPRDIFDVMHMLDHFGWHTSGPAGIPAASRLVIDAPTRMFHWLFALSFVGAYSDRQPSGTPQGPPRRRASFRWVTPNRAPPASRRWGSRG